MERDVAILLAAPALRGAAHDPFRTQKATVVGDALLKNKVGKFGRGQVDDDG